MMVVTSGGGGGGGGGGEEIWSTLKQMCHIELKDYLKKGVE